MVNLDSSIKEMNKCKSAAKVNLFTSKQKFV